MCIGTTCLELMKVIDKKVIEALNKNNINNESFDDQVVYAPGTIKTKEENHIQFLLHLKEGGLKISKLIF